MELAEGGERVVEGTVTWGEAVATECATEHGPACFDSPRLC